MNVLAEIPASRLLWPSAVGDALRRCFSFPVLLGSLLVFGALRGSVANFIPKWNGDVWWHLAVGEHILTTKTWPTADFYSFTVFGNDWTAYEWLGDVVLTVAMRLGGLPGLVALTAGMASALLLLLYYSAYLRCKQPKAAFVSCLLLSPLAAIYFAPRPQVLGYIFLLLTLICLERFRQGLQKSLWPLPVIFLFWVNTHGSFAFGLLVLTAYWLSGLRSFSQGLISTQRWTFEQRRHLAWTALLSVIAITVTPYGTRLAAYPLELAFLQPVNLFYIPEWQSPVFHSPVWKLFLVSMLLFFLGLLLFRISYRLEEVGLLLFALYTTFVHRRFLIVFVLVFAPMLAVLLSRWIQPFHPAKQRWALNAGLLSLIALGLIFFFPSRESLTERVAEGYPVSAVSYLREHPVDGKLLNDSDWGGYLIWSFDAQRRVFIDGRADIYEYGGVLEDWFHMKLVGPNTTSLLRKYGIEACLLERKSALSTFLGASPDWEQTYSDDLSALFVRRRFETSAPPLAPF